MDFKEVPDGLYECNKVGEIQDWKIKCYVSGGNSFIYFIRFWNGGLRVMGKGIENKIENIFMMVEKPIWQSEVQAALITSFRSMYGSMVNIITG